MGYFLRPNQYGFDFAIYNKQHEHSMYLLRIVHEPVIQPTSFAAAMRVSNQVKKGCVFAWVEDNRVDFISFQYVREWLFRLG